MGYLKRTGEDGRLLRARVGNAFPWARSAVVCFANYESAQPRSTDAAAEGLGWIARYAWSSRADANGVRRPSDYHKVLRKRLRALEENIREMRMREGWGEFEARGFVDTGPVVERALAMAAGVGWTGKNTCLIHPRLGSFGFLAVLITSLEVSESASQQVSGSASQQVSGSASQQAGRAATSAVRLATEGSSFEIPDRCGTCRRCLEACPTGALTAPYQMDAARCIAYLTIEHRGAIAPELMEGMGRQVFGCDICQDVCPWNSPRRLVVSADPELEARGELVNPALEWLAGMDEAEFERWFNGSPVRRAGFDGLRRNLAVAMGNSGMGRFVARLEEWVEDADEGVRTAAVWALGKLRGKW
jgi:epoxyqueuosine reductase